MARPQRGPGSDRLIVARLSGTARRNARWGDLTEVQKTAGVTELREVAGDRADLLAEVAGIALGTSEGKGEEYLEQGRAVAELCTAAGADQSLIPQWIDEGRRRAEAAGLPPFSRPRAGRRRGTLRHRSVPDIVVRVDTSEIEAWTLEVVRRLKAGEQLEDRRVELKREWPTPQAGSYAKAARQLEGLANANHPEHVLWLVGLDERQRQIVGADPVETASWWTGVGSCFDGDPPDLADVVVTVDGRTVVALCFGTSGAPFVVKNPLHGTSGHVMATEVPWRDGTRVRTARKHELRTLLAPRLTIPEILVQNASLTLHGTTETDSQVRPRWTGQMVWSVESLVPKRLTLPFYRMTLQLELLDHGYSAPVQLHFNDTRRLAYSDGAPDVRYVGDYIVIDGPGLIEALLASDGEAPPLPPEARGSSATVTLTMPTPGLPTCRFPRTWTWMLWRCRACPRAARRCHRRW